jgi:preprotein translocase subunit SecE
VKAFFRELFRTGLYKRTQGRITRQVTFFVIAATIALGLWQLNYVMMDQSPALRFGLLGLLLALGLWLGYRIVNVPAAADFLIAVEAEMNKVSWPTKTELWRSSLVVLFTIFALAATLYAFDIFWFQLFQAMGIL